MTAFTDVFIYTRPSCPRCKVLKAMLDNAGIKYNELRDFDENELIAEGFEDLPVLSVDGKLMGLFEASAFIREAVQA